MVGANTIFNYKVRLEKTYQRLRLLMVKMNYSQLILKHSQRCKLARKNRNKVGKSDFKTAPDFGHCASQGTYYCGYNLHAVTSLNGVIYSFDLTKASVQNIQYLNDVKCEFSDYLVIGDKGYLNKEILLNLFTTEYNEHRIRY